MVSSIRFNIFSNFLTQIWTGLVQLLFIPAYINILGNESYGLISLYPSLLSLFTALDLGFGNTLNRELTKYSINSTAKETAADLTFTLEIIFWIIGLAIGLLFASSANWVASTWLNKTQLPQEKVYGVFILMGVLTFVRWPISLYNGGMVGIQRQNSLNTIAVIMETLRAVGVIFILKFVSNGIYSFFIWQILVTALNTFILRITLWKSICPPKYRPVFSKQLLSQITNFSIGLSGITLLKTLSMHADKLILSKIVSLNMLGYYTFSFSIALVLTRVVNPIITAFYPRFVQAIYTQDYTSQRNLYHQSSQLLAVIIIPIALTLSFFTEEILGIWLNNPSTTAQCAPLVRILILGSMINGLITIPYYFQLANAWTKLALRKNMISFLVSIPLLIWSSNKYGTQGASFVWLGINVSYIIIEQYIFHHKFLQGEMINWYLKDIAMPLLSASVILGSGKVLLQRQNEISNSYQILLISFIAFSSFIASAYSVTFTRDFMTKQWLYIKNKLLMFY